MIPGLRLEDGAYGLRAVATGRWSDDLTRWAIDQGVSELELNDGKGGCGSDIRFLSDLSELRAFKIIDLRIQDVAPIHRLGKLLALEVITYCRTPIDFDAFPALEQCNVEWRPRTESLFRRSTLKRLCVNRYAGRDVSPFGQLTALDSLSILTAPIHDLKGLGSLMKLRHLRLGNLRRLTSLSGPEQLVNIEELEIHTCRAIRSIEEIGQLTNLRRLSLSNDGEIDSLRPLAYLVSLESLVFYESTNVVDGDLSPLLGLKNLSNVAFQNRRHYSHRREDIELSQAK
jgi:Leucine-rich repeat (LRR) protein